MSIHDQRQSATNSLNVDAVPVALSGLCQWVCWKLEPRKDGTFTKVPYSARTGRKASSTDSATWADFATAVRASGGYSGPGFVLTLAAGIVGVDLDHCVRDGVIDEWAQVIVDSLASYTELSPSGTGLHIFVYGKLPPGGRKRGQVEAYDSARFLTVTGHHLPGTPSTIETRELAGFHARYFGPQPTPVQSAPGRTPPHVDTSGLLARAFKAVNGESIRRLFEGDTSGYPSKSEADLALCSHLAFYARGDGHTVDELFRSSALYRDKWDRPDYRARTLARVGCAV